MSKAKELAQPVELENGERVLLGTRRPDGTLRKERRIRPGYTPVDEQATYQSSHVLARQNVPICPGMDPAMLAEAHQAMSKAAKKNEKRKEKKTSASVEVTGSLSGDRSERSAPVEPVTEQLKTVSVSSGTARQTTTASSRASPTVSVPPSSGAPVTEPEDPRAAAEKSLRALKKKVRQAEALVEKRDAGTAITAEETDKISKLSEWLEEVHKLEVKIATS